MGEDVGKTEGSESHNPEKESMLQERSSNDENSQIRQPIGVDTGWAWLVMIAVFVIFFILDGLSCTFGLLYVDFLDYFHSGKGETAMIGALLYGVPLLVTPFCCGCIEIAGFRRVTIAGGVVTFLVFFVSVFANSVQFLTVAIGVVAAAAMALSYDAGLLCLSHYFDKRRGLATGIAMSSTGVGTFVFAPFIEYLLNTYAWRGCLLILSGLCMNVIACGAIFRPLQYKSEPDNKPRDTSRDNHVTNEYSNGGKRIRRISTSLVDLKEKTPPVAVCYSDLNLYRECSVPESRDQVNSWTSYSSIRNIAAATAAANSKPETETSSVKRLLHEFARVFKLCFDRKLFRNPKWVLFVISNCLYCTSFGFPYIYIPHLAIVSQIDDEKAALLLSVLGIATTVFLLLSAAAADYTRHVVLLYACTMLCSGSALVTFPFISGHYVAMCLATVLFSVGVGANFAMGTLIIIDIVGLDDLVVAYGQLGFLQGIATTFGTPSGGWVFDAVGSYDPAFIAAGVAVLLSGIVLLPFPLIDARMKRIQLREERRQNP